MFVRAPVPLLALFLTLSAAAPVAAQDPPPVPDEEPAPEAPSLQVEPISPGGAFLRSLLVPGWGHLATGSHVRGGFYAAAQGAAWWMLWKSASQRRAAGSLRAEERSIVMERFRAQGTTDPDSLALLADEDPRVEDWDDLIEARGDQVEDWIALGVFLTLMGAADAFVAAHLMDFPEPLSIRVLPGPGSWGRDGPGVEIRVSLPADVIHSWAPWRRPR